MTETQAGGWSITAQLPPQIQRRMISAAQEDRQAERDMAAERDQRYEEAANRALAMGIANAEARGEWAAPLELATVRLPADDKERAERTQAAIQHVLDVQRAQYQRELDWEKEHPPPPAGPPEKLHAFVAEPVLVTSPVKRTIASRSRHWQEWQEKKKAAEAARRAVKADLDHGLIDGVVIRRER